MVRKEQAGASVHFGTKILQFSHEDPFGQVKIKNFRTKS